MENNTEIIDLLSREAIKKLHGANMELKSKLECLSSKLESYINTSREATQSAEQHHLLEALGLAKNEMAASSIERSGHIVNRGSYATLDDIRIYVDPILSKYGLTFRTEPAEQDDKDYLLAYLGHKSGQWYSSLSRIRVDYSKGGDAIQAYGKALTSMKRYVYGAFFMLHTGGDKD
jgi:hypothetical protein